MFQLSAVLLWTNLKLRYIYALLNAKTILSFLTNSY